MILAAAIGLAVQHWGSSPDALVQGVLVGMLVALFVPTGKSTCPVLDRSAG